MGWYHRVHFAYENYHSICSLFTLLVFSQLYHPRTPALLVYCHPFLLASPSTSTACPSSCPPPPLVLESHECPHFSPYLPSTDPLSRSSSQLKRRKMTSSLSLMSVSARKEEDYWPQCIGNPPTPKGTSLTTHITTRGPQRESWDACGIEHEASAIPQRCNRKWTT